MLGCFADITGITACSCKLAYNTRTLSYPFWLPNDQWVHNILTTVMTRIVVEKSTHHAKPHLICFFLTTMSKITKELFVKICWQLKTPTRAWKCTRSEFPLKNFCKLAKHSETRSKNVWEKCNEAYSWSIQTTINHISVSIRARDEKGIAGHIDGAGCVVWTLVDNGKLVNHSQVV